MKAQIVLTLDRSDPVIHFGRLVSIVALLVMIGTSNALASDHLDTPTVVANPQADIGDVYEWTSPDGRKLNLVMIIVGHSFSDKIQYIFHVDSGADFGKTTVSTNIACRFSGAHAIDCRVGDIDRAAGDASKPDGLEGQNHQLRVFAGSRDDPFFNNVKGSRDAFRCAAAALRAGADVDGAGFPQFDPATIREISDRWRHTDGGPPNNFLAGWMVSAIVISVDLRVVNKGGEFLAIWAETSSPERRIDRAGRPLVANALLGPLAPHEVSDKLKEQYNEATPSTSAQFIPEIQKSLGLYDGYDGKWGNQFLADRDADLTDTATEPSLRYRALATLLADDRLWVNGSATICNEFFAVERCNLVGQVALSNDCGGRTPNYDAANAFRSLLVNGTTVGIDDGLHHDEREHSTTVFPFLAPPSDVTDRKDGNQEPSYQ